MHSGDDRLISRDQAIAAGLSHFFTGAPCKNGHVCARLVKNWTCPECVLMWSLARKNDPRKVERGREYACEWRAKNPERARELSRAQYASNPGKAKAIVRAWRERNPQYQKEYLEIWHKNNPIKVREYTSRRRSRKILAEGRHTSSDIERIFQAQGGQCAMPWCRGKLMDGRWHVDHIIPLSKGGSNWPSNIQIVHDTCNRSKGAKDPIRHAQENGMLL